MDIHNLVKMANQIGAFFESMPDREEAKADIAAHLWKFWDPRMRKALVSSIDDGQAAELSPMVREAIEANRAVLL